MSPELKGSVEEVIASGPNGYIYDELQASLKLDSEVGDFQDNKVRWVISL